MLEESLEEMPQAKQHRTDETVWACMCHIAVNLFALGAAS